MTYCLFICLHNLMVNAQTYKMGLKILLFVPNIIGYIRILLLLVCWWTFNYPLVFFPCYVVFIILDGFDGFAARQLNQVSEFGAWFDVAIDNFGRTMLWTLLFKWGHFVSSLEWCVFVCMHNSMGADWKNKFGEGPWWVRKTMANDKEGHHFDWDNTSILGQAKQRHAREFLEAWHSNQNSINKHIDLEPIYHPLRKRTGNDITNPRKPNQINRKRDITPALRRRLTDDVT
ncbi:uncharacterized protein si:ch1073-145m9.1 isoform X3 [Stegostoma tigrinum]|uniref:uncharacterized protein si:ch1073-145m9.1 isoform X3 n=1 Tax=Stegostoma tigrinum TaxID=3053191 RepID=UPI002870901E|nr:uncharacterized protein si:ch1073-145m9.1 isoform X3 [Stegostoma tigrinum]